MGTITEKLEYLNSTKEAIKNAILEKGVEVDVADSFRSYANKISNIVIEDTTKLRDLIQESCENLEIPEGTTKIRSYAFYNYNHPIAITVPSSVTTLEGQCFMNCNGLTSITLPETITLIPTQAFCGCESLQSIIIPNSVTSMAYGAFMSCSSLVDVKLSDNISTIPMQAFSQCTKLKNITLPNNLQTIENSVFYYSNAIKTINIPASITSIASSAFSSCGLEDIYIDKPNNAISGAPWGAKNATVYWNDGTKREPSLEDLFG